MDFRMMITIHPCKIAEYHFNRYIPARKQKKLKKKNNPTILKSFSTFHHKLATRSLPAHDFNFSLSSSFSRSCLQLFCPPSQNGHFWCLLNEISTVLLFSRTRQWLVIIQAATHSMFNAYIPISNVHRRILFNFISSKKEKKIHFG